MNGYEGKVWCDVVQGWVTPEQRVKNERQYDQDYADRSRGRSQENYDEHGGWK